jgi:hypothetical protein
VNGLKLKGKRRLIEMETKVIYVTVALTVPKELTEEEVNEMVNELDYNFKHENIIDTELISQSDEY